MPTGGFELRIVEPDGDGAEGVERFSDSSDLAKKRHAVIDEAKNARGKGFQGWNL